MSPTDDLQDGVKLAGVIREAIAVHAYAPSQEAALYAGKGADVPDLADFIAARLNTRSSLPVEQDGMREALRQAYEQGCVDTHNSIQAEPELALMSVEAAEFGEAADDYAVQALRDAKDRFLFMREDDDPDRYAAWVESARRASDRDLLQEAVERTENLLKLTELGLPWITDAPCFASEDFANDLRVLANFCRQALTERAPAVPTQAQREAVARIIDPALDRSYPMAQEGVLAKADAILPALSPVGRAGDLGSVAGEPDGSSALPRHEQAGSATPSEANEPMVLIAADDPERKPRLYACRKCGQVYSPRIYACREEQAQATARRAACECYSCRTHNICQDCGTECEKHWLVCAPCRRARKLAKATQIDVETVEECFGFDSGEYYHSTHDAADAGEEWVHPAELETFELSADRVAEWILEDHHEDAEVADLVGFDVLADAIEAFNKRQTGGSYREDQSRKARVPPPEEDVADLVASDGEARDGEAAERPNPDSHPLTTPPQDGSQEDRT